MPEISLTDFVDFPIKSGTPKLTKVTQIKQRPDYNPAFDFWKPIRDSIVNFHKTDGENKQILGKIGTTADDRRQGRYQTAIKGYQKFLGRKTVSWFSPPCEVWTCNGLAVRINPELGLKINGTETIIKLYFKDESPTRHRIQAVLELMRIALDAAARERTIAVLDVTNSRIMELNPNGPNLKPLLEGETASFMQIWKNL